MPTHTPIPTDPIGLASWIIQFARDRGFAQAGLCRAEPTRYARELDAWLAAGKHGDMAYLADQAERRRDPAAELPGARSIIMVADQYADGTPDAPAEPGRGRVARYARGRDYHWFIKRRLHNLADALRPRFPGHEFRTFVDTAPVLEREHAARAGLGWVGKHTLVLHPRLGSFFLLGGILTTLDLQPPTPPGAIEDACGSCTRCLDACPTQAITPYSVEASRCISYLTIEHRGPVPPSLHAAMGDWVFGCDVCQDVCPHNRPATAGDKAVNEAYAPRFGPLDLEAILTWDRGLRTAALEGTAMKRARLDMLKRNALIAMGNAAEQVGRDRVIARLREIASDELASELLRVTARQVLERLGVV